MQSKGLVLVTGGSGYIAGYCILQLLNEGWRVRTTVRDLKREVDVRRTLAANDQERLTFRSTDLMADAGWAAAADKADYVLHVASPLPARDPRSDDELVRPAREGTLRVLRAARDAGVKRVVVTSSTAAVSYGHGGRTRPDTEEQWSDPTNIGDTSPYVRSKIHAERAAWNFIQTEGGALQMATVNPSGVLGPVLGSDFSTSIEIVKKLLDGSFPGCPRMGWPLVDVRDVADLHIRAMTHPDASGQRFLAAGEFLWFRDLASILKARLPEAAARVPTFVLPDWAVRLAAMFDPTTRSVLFELGKPRPVSTEKAQRLLGWCARPSADMVAECAQSLFDHGILPARRRRRDWA